MTLHETFGEMSDFIFEVLNLATGIPEPKRIQAISTLKILAKDSIINLGGAFL